MSNFDDVGRFHEKFDLPNVTHGGPAPRPLTAETLTFRIKFMLEELTEYCSAVGMKVVWALGQPDPGRFVGGTLPPQDLALAFDALLDLAYVVLGTAHMHGFPWQAGWDEVQRANMAKARGWINHEFRGNGVDDVCTGSPDENPCLRPESLHSKRGSNIDVIKPRGWTPPDITAVLARYGWRP